MIEKFINWSEIKTIKSNQSWSFYYSHQTAVTGVTDEFYLIYTGSTQVIYIAKITGSTDITDFVDNHKTSAIAVTSEDDAISKMIQHDKDIPQDGDGKRYSRAESRPLDTTTYFTMAGDKTTTPQEIGGGKEICWDFSNTTDDVASPPTGKKRKRLEFSFIDSVYVKEGALYFKDAPAGCYVDFYVVCPNGQYYLKNDGTPTLATADIAISKFVNKHFIRGDTKDGDELNTEAASSSIPSTYKFWIEITTPDTDSTSSGHISLELYRTRTVILE